MMNKIRFVREEVKGLTCPFTPGREYEIHNGSYFQAINNTAPFPMLGDVLVVDDNGFFHSLSGAYLENNFEILI